jgi:hypothetical protein
MKFFLRIAVVVGVIFGILWLLNQMVQEKRSAPPQAAITPPPAPSPTPLPASVTPGVVMTPSVPAALPHVQAVAQQVGAQVTGFRQADGWTLVSVAANDRNKLNEFLDKLQRSGMRDLDAGYQQYRQSVGRDGRTVFENTYRVRF